MYSSKRKRWHIQYKRRSRTFVKLWITPRNGWDLLTHVKNWSCAVDLWITSIHLLYVRARSANVHPPTRHLNSCFIVIIHGCIFWNINLWTDKKEILTFGTGTTLTRHPNFAPYTDFYSPKKFLVVYTSERWGSKSHWKALRCATNALVVELVEKHRRSSESVVSFTFVNAAVNNGWYILTKNSTENKENYCEKNKTKNRRKIANFHSI